MHSRLTREDQGGAIDTFTRRRSRRGSILYLRLLLPLLFVSHLLTDDDDDAGAVPLYVTGVICTMTRCLRGSRADRGFSEVRGTPLALGTCLRDGKL